MARFANWLVVALILSASAAPHRAAAEAEDAGSNTVSLSTISSGNTTWDYLRVTASGDLGDTSTNVPTRPGRYCYYSNWVLHRVDSVIHVRIYAIYIYDSCHNDKQIFPSNAD